MNEQQQADARKELSQKRIEWLKEKQLLLQKIDHLEQTIKDYDEREMRYKETQKRLLSALELVDNNKDTKVTQNMIKSLTEEVRLIRTSKDMTVFDGITIDEKRSRDDNIVIQKEFDYHKEKSKNLGNNSSQRMNKSDNKKWKNQLQRDQFKDRRSLATALGKQKKSIDMERLEEFFSKRNKRLFEESVENDFDRGDSIEAKNHHHFGGSLAYREKTKSYPAHLLTEMQKEVSEERRENLTRHKKVESLTPLRNQQEVEDYFGNFKDLKLLQRRRKKRNESEYISESEESSRKEMQEENMFFSTKKGISELESPETDDAMMRYKQELNQKFNSQGFKEDTESMFNSGKNFNKKYKTQDYHSNAQHPQNYTTFENLRRRTEEKVLRPSKLLRRSAYLKTKSNHESKKNLEEQKPVYGSLSQFYSKKGISSSVSRLKKTLEEKTERNHYVNLRKDYLKTSHKPQKEMMRNVLSSDQILKRLNKKSPKIYSHSNSQLDFSVIGQRRKKQVPDFPQIDKSEKSSTIFYKATDPVRIKSIKINMKNQDVQMELTNGMKPRGESHKVFFDKEAQNGKTKSVDVSKFKARSSKGFQSYLCSKEETETESESSFGGRKLFEKKLNTYLKKSMRKSYLSKQAKNSKISIAGQQDDCNISKKEVIEILKLHKNLQSKIKFLENRFNKY